MNLEEARYSLPWYAVGALSAEEARAVEAHLADSAELQRELQELRALQRVVSTQAATEPPFRPALIADAWQRIEAYEKSRRAATSARRARWSARLLERLRDDWRELTTPVRWALVAQSAAVLALAAVIVVPRLEPAVDDKPSVYTTASGATAAVPHGGVRFTVAFQPTATEGELRELLSRLSVQVVAGPTAEQLYTLHLSDAATADKALAQLRASPVVRFATPEGQ